MYLEKFYVTYNSLRKKMTASNLKLANIKGCILVKSCKNFWQESP